MAKPNEEIARLIHDAEVQLNEAKRWNLLPGVVTEEKKHRSEDLATHHIVLAIKALQDIVLP